MWRLRVRVRVRLASIHCAMNATASLGICATSSVTSEPIASLSLCVCRYSSISGSSCASASGAAAFPGVLEALSRR